MSQLPSTASSVSEQVRATVLASEKELEQASVRVKESVSVPASEHRATRQACPAECER
jgi:hypothetical protein